MEPSAASEREAAALAALRPVVGDDASDDTLRSLLRNSDNDVQRAVSAAAPHHFSRATQRAHTASSAPQANAFFTEPSPAAPVIRLGAKRPAPPAAASAAPAKRASVPASASASGSVGADSRRPLAERMRPRALDELLGQADALNDVLKQAMARDRLPSLILWGPPGCGKTSFAACVASCTRRAFRSLSAAKAGVGALREELERAASAQRLLGTSTILFVDEIHRWSKAQQDALLADAERGSITLIGATTENPSFCVNNAILSRCRLLVFSKLSADALGGVLERALATDAALAGVRLTPEARAALCAAADGDARAALNALELAATGRADATGPIDAPDVLAAVQRRSLYDRNGDFHYDLISALHKSLRGGDADAALYYVARMLHGGEEPRYVTRRLIRFASEDVGLADPHALPQAVAADQAVHAIGMPEAGVVIAQAAAYLALAPKSCAIYRGFNRAMAAARDEENAPVPLHIRNAPTKLMKELSYGKDYVYNPGSGYARGCDEGYLPATMTGRRFFDRHDCEPGHSLKFCEEPPSQPR
jgi:putative ATPase